MIDFLLLRDDFTKLVSIKYNKPIRIRQHVQAVDEFCDYLQTKGAHHFSPTKDDITDYFEYLSTRKNQKREGTLSASTINHHLFGLRTLFKYLLDAGYFDALPRIPDNLKTIREPQVVLTVKEILQVYANCNTQFDTALISSAYGCGLRRSEIANLKLEDVDLLAGNLIVQSGKGSKRREVPMSNKVIVDFKTYLNGERNQLKNGDHFFLSENNGKKMLGNMLGKRFKMIIRRIAELDEGMVTLHALRRSIATHLANNGAGIYFIREFLGHTEIDTAQLYVLNRQRQSKIN